MAAVAPFKPDTDGANKFAMHTTASQVRYKSAHEINPLLAAAMETVKAAAQLPLPEVKMHPEDAAALPSTIRTTLVRLPAAIAASLLPSAEAAPVPFAAVGATTLPATMVTLVHPAAILTAPAATVYNAEAAVSSGYSPRASSLARNTLSDAAVEEEAAAVPSSGNMAPSSVRKLLLYEDAVLNDNINAIVTVTAVTPEALSSRGGTCMAFFLRFFL